MYIHLGEDTLVKSDNIIGIFDLDTATVMKSSREYLKKATKEKRIINVSYDLPKSFIVSAEDDYRVYISLLSPATISSRAKNKSRRFE
ncbi:MAG: DUF370 domain-containing protein [Clostridia bacterium]|nr:DUF370 domain-containing protein [Clostridia bacterium]